MTEYKVNLKNIKTIQTLHQELKDSLNFPDYYGMNIDAFWDCITCDIETPATIMIEGITSLPNDLENEKNLLIGIMSDAVEWYKNADKILKVVYLD